MLPKDFSAAVAVKAQQIQSADTNEIIDDPGNYTHVSEKKGDKIELKKPINPQLMAPMITMVNAVQSKNLFPIKNLLFTLIRNQ